MNSWTHSSYINVYLINYFSAPIFNIISIIYRLEIYQPIISGKSQYQNAILQQKLPTFPDKRQWSVASFEPKTLHSWEVK